MHGEWIHTFTHTPLATNDQLPFHTYTLLFRCDLWICMYFNFAIASPKPTWETFHRSESSMLNRSHNHFEFMPCKPSLDHLTYKGIQNIVFLSLTASSIQARPSQFELTTGGCRRCAKGRWKLRVFALEVAIHRLSEKRWPSTLQGQIDAAENFIERFDRGNFQEGGARLSNQTHFPTHSLHGAVLHMFLVCPF